MVYIYSLGWTCAEAERLAPLPRTADMRSVMPPSQPSICTPSDCRHSTSRRRSSCSEAARVRLYSARSVLFCSSVRFIARCSTQDMRFTCFRVMMCTTTTPGPSARRIKSQQVTTNEIMCVRIDEYKPLQPESAVLHYEAGVGPKKSIHVEAED